MTACRACGLAIAPYAVQVQELKDTFHKDCFEQWYFDRHRARPRLLPGGGTERHIFRQVSGVPA